MTRRIGTNAVQSIENLTETQTENLAAALALAKAGFVIFPAKADKAPIKGFTKKNLAPSTWNPETHTVEVVAATDTLVARRDKVGAYAERLDMATLDLSTAKDLPVFFAHKPACTSREIAGIVESLRVESGQLIAVLRLSQADDNLPLIQRVADGTVSGVSIG